jgi:hypothetical protein
MLNRCIFAVMSIALLAGVCKAQQPLEKLKDFRIDGLVRFKTAEEAEATRGKLIKAIWPAGLPTTRPARHDVAKDSPEVASIDASLFTSVTRLDVNVSGFDWYAHVFVLKPKTVSPKGTRLAIVHGGHMPEGPKNYLISGLSDSANQLLREGFVVALIQMPLIGWNKDRNGVIDGKDFEVSRRSTSGHDDLFAEVEPTLKAGAMRFFLEPITQALNEMLVEYPKPELTLMIGLSGGGWTTHLYSAVDTRVDVSIPVAGALPLYARPFSPGSKGDAEQEYAGIFSEEDTDKDGVLDKATGAASWLEVFALGGISPTKDRPRTQIQVLNLYDSCCFNGEVYKTYAEPLASRVAAIERGSWSIFIDDSHRDHLISEHVLKNVLAKTTSP